MASIFTIGVCLWVVPIHLLDDFLIVAPSDPLCHKQLDIFLSLCGYLGIPIAPEKTCGPSTILSFAGIELDTVQSQARLPQDKLIKVYPADFPIPPSKESHFTGITIINRPFKFCLLCCSAWSCLPMKTYRSYYRHKSTTSPY